MASRLPPRTELVSDEQGILRRISHARWPYPPARYVAASPVSLARRYLEEFGDRFALQGLLFPGDHVAVARSGVIKLELLGVKAIRDVTVVSFGQTHAGLPVFQSGVSVRVKSDLSAVVGAQSTLHLDIDLDFERAHRYKDEPLPGSALARVLGLQPSANEPKVVGSRLVICRYLPAARLDPSLQEHDQPESAPQLKLPQVPDQIIANSHYFAWDVEFSLELPKWGELLWRALIEVETQAVLYLRAYVESCTGAIFRDDPITLSGDTTKDACATAASLDPLAEVVTLMGLNPSNPQTLSGEYVELVDSDSPVSPAPTAAQPACQFVFPSTSDDFAAVNAYHHMDALYRMVAEMGFVNYFAGTSFPIPMDHRGEGGGVNAHHHGSGSGTTKYRFGLAQSGCAVGIACDRRVVIHEFGHSVLRNHIDSGVFLFAHGVGDTMAVILSDPATQAPDRFETFPFSGVNRRHDRDVAAGWGWGGAFDTGGYSSTQILSTTLFRAYRSIGGDAAQQNEREFAARFATYLVLAAVGSETPVAQPTNAEDFAADLIDADLTTTTFEGQPGGAVHKVIRWAFEKQDAFGGVPPQIDVYIDDGRNGEYHWIEDFSSTAEIWVRREPDGGTTNQNALVGTPAYVYVRVRNRGREPAEPVAVEAFTGPTDPNAEWPGGFSPLATPELSVPGPIPPGGDVVVGPFEWAPPATTSRVSIVMSSTTPQDPSNVETVTGSLPIRRLVPFDNNIAKLDVSVIRYPYEYAVKFVCGTAGDSCSCGSPVAPGTYFTAINIHNPGEKPTRFRSKVAIALPDGQTGYVSPFTFSEVGPDGALEIACPEIYRRVGLPKGCLLKGFVVLQSVVELDVVAVYSATGADKQVETMDIERVSPRVHRTPPPPDETPELEPDLIPLPAFPPPSPNTPGRLPQNFCFSTTGAAIADALRIIVRNQGAADAPASVTQVSFANNPPSQVPTPAIAAGSEVTVEARIPRGCFLGEGSCSFKIRVNATNAFTESDSTNNEVNGSCPGIAT